MLVPGLSAGRAASCLSGGALQARVLRAVGNRDQETWGEVRLVSRFAGRRRPMISPWEIAI